MHFISHKLYYWLIFFAMSFPIFLDSLSTTLLLQTPYITIQARIHKLYEISLWNLKNSRCCRYFFILELVLLIIFTSCLGYHVDSFIISFCMAWCLVTFLLISKVFWLLSFLHKFPILVLGLMNYYSIISIFFLAYNFPIMYTDTI